MDALAEQLIEELLDSGEETYVYKAYLQIPHIKILNVYEQAFVVVLVKDENGETIPATKTAGRLARQSSTVQAPRVCECCHRPF